MPSTASKNFSSGRESNTRFLLMGKNLCVDFANTIRAPAGGEDGLASWERLVGFLEAVGIVRAAQAQQLRELAAEDPQATAVALRVAMELRDASLRILEAVAARQEIPPQCVEPINKVLRWTEGYDQLLPGGSDGKGWRLGFRAREQRLEWLLAAIARSAADLIAEGLRAPVRKCAHPACLFYFYDVSRTGRRRWCSMAVCGNRSKVAAHARRTAARKEWKEASARKTSQPAGLT